ncbi:Rab-GTPase-TBC domain [Trinorchestia longiramus]|nr:Rab-GTPase-TBC domain [Trinorchestia longiramus]
MAYKVRLAEFDSILQADKINLSKLQELCFAGIPDEGGRRALCWRLLLHSLPLDRHCWDQHLHDKRKQYHAFVDDIVVGGSINNSTSSSNEALHTSYSSSNCRVSDASDLDTSSGSSRCNGSLDSSTVESSKKPPSSLPYHKRSYSNSSSKTNSSSSSNSLCSDHPLNLSPDSQWGSFFKDNEVLGQIDKDVRRLCPDMCFFQRLTPHPRPDTPRLYTRVSHTPLHATSLPDKLSSAHPRQRGARKSPSPPPENLPPGSEAHWEVLERVLFVYAKLNPGQGYVQGMNEIIGPLYYVLASTPADAEHAEADTFWLFTSLMADVRDLFIRTLDDSESGIGRLMTRLMSCLRDQDAATSDRLAHQGVKEQYFAFRWLSLLFSQEFPLPDVIRMWDSLLASPDRHRCLVLLATAMITLQRDKLLVGDFAANVKLLQNYPPCDVGAIICKAVELSEHLLV